jgi:hypothetical protein
MVFVRKKILSNEIKHHTLLHILTCAVIFLLIHILFGTGRLKKDTVLIITERFLPLMAVILLTPCFEYELEEGINEVISSKSVPIICTYFIRLIWRIVLYILLSLIYIYILKIKGSYMKFFSYAWESISIGLFLGSLGLLVSGSTSNLIVGYLVSLVYYLSQWIIGWKAFGIFYLFRIGKGLEPMILFNITISFILLSIVFLKKSVNGKLNV